MPDKIVHNATPMYDDLRARVTQEIEEFGEEVGIKAASQALAILLAEVLASAPDENQEDLKAFVMAKFERSYKKWTTH